MKNKIIILLIVIFLAGLSPLYPKPAITNFEYLKGVDFVQLHFKTDTIVPIPDLFYPIQNNFKYIVMRIENVNFKVPADNLDFKSNVIEKMEVKKNNSGVDVEIYLKERVNYRVFSNKNGLYIEFPKEKKDPVGKTVPILKKESEKKLPVTGKKKPETGINFKKSAFLKGISVIKSTNEMLKFNIGLSGPVKYNVIPIENNPARLAIDF